MTSATGFIAPFFFEQFRYPNGNPLGGGYIESYVSETMIPKRLFSDVYLQIPHTNPMYLDASGFVPEYYMEEGLYTLVLKSAEGLTIATRDNVRGSVGSGQNLTGNYLPLAGGTMTGTIVSEANIVMGSDNSGADVANAPILIVGDGNNTSGSANVVMFGNYNTIKDADYSNVLGGAYNIISGDTYQSTVVGGWYNTIGSESTKSAIVGGTSNKMNAGNNSTILGGFQNNVDNTSFTSIVGGSNNVISGGGTNSSIVGGSGNINSGGQRTVLLGGTGLQSYYNDQVILGKYNYQSNQALIIGNGTSDEARNNAFTVSQAGDVNAVSYAGDTIQIGNVSNTEFQRLDGVSANIQSQLSTLSASSHTHSNKELLDLINQSLNTSADVQFDTLSANVINVGSDNVIETNYASILGTTYQTVRMPDGRRWMAENLSYVNGGIGQYWNNSTNDGNGAYYLNSDLLSLRDSLSASDWRIPTKDELLALRTELLTLSPSSAGGILKTTGTTYWDSPNAGADNSLGFNLHGAGYYSDYIHEWRLKRVIGQFCGLDSGDVLYTLGGQYDDSNISNVGPTATTGDRSTLRLIYDPIAPYVPNRILFGNNLISQADGQLILGQYNDNVPTNIVEIGKGTSELDRKNIFAIDNMGGVSATELELGVTVMGTEDPATLPMHFRVEGGTDSWWPNILTLQSNSEKYTIAQLQAPWQDDITVGEREATFTLMRADRDGSSEFLDLYNNHYDASKIMGLVIQKRGAGVLRNFYFGTYGGSGPANAQFENDIALIDNTNKEWKFWYPIRTENGIKITDNVPVDTSATLYNSAGTLYWAGSPITNRRYATTINIAASYGQTFTITHNLGYLRPNINITYGVTGEMILIDPTYISVNQLSFVINSKKVMNNVNVEVSF